MMIQSEATTMSEADQKFWDYFNVEVMPSEASNSTSREEIIVTPEGWLVGLYCVLMVTGALGNVAVFVSLVRSRRRKSRVNLLMTHLAVADLIVTVIVIPLEIVWKITNAWMAGNLACKFFSVLRAFGLYLSSNVLVCISLDRFFAVLYPLRLPIARKRSKMMLTFAWVIAFICSLPQSIVFRVMSHPEVPDFQQCIALGSFSNLMQELTYNVFGLCAVYILPLLIITVCYACIFYEISKNSKEITDKCISTDHTRIQLRRSDQRPLARARRRTLRMTVTIVTVFACCWLPYATMTLWYMIDRESAKHLPRRLQDVFFVMAVSNSCMDPLVYGSYTLDFRTFLRMLRKIFCAHSMPSEMPGISVPGTLKSKLPTNDAIPADPVRAKTARRYTVRFEETSLAAPSASSDPIQPWSDRSVDEQILRPIKPSVSCEVFTLYTPKDRFD